MDESHRVFDRSTLRARRDRAARSLGDHDFLFVEAATSLAERLDEVTRRFPLALELGCRDGRPGRAFAGRGGIETRVRLDLSAAFAGLAGASDPDPVIAADEEFLPFRPGIFDLVVSPLVLHWVNDLPGTLIQIRRVLKPDGLFLGALLGGETLTQLRQALMAAELEIEGGAGPRISPFADVRDMGSLLQRAGFALPMVDRDVLTVTYETVLDLMGDLRAMGESNVVRERRRSFSRRETLLRAAEIYGQRFTAEGGRVVASFEIVYLTAWAPHESQPQPLRPGSAQTRLADALGAEEIDAGDTARPGGSRKS